VSAAAQTCERSAAQSSLLDGGAGARGRGCEAAFGAALVKASRAASTIRLTMR
jgi:hypothetical protein